MSKSFLRDDTLHIQVVRSTQAVCSMSTQHTSTSNDNFTAFCSIWKGFSCDLCLCVMIADQNCRLLWFFAGMSDVISNVRPIWYKDP